LQEEKERIEGEFNEKSSLVDSLNSEISSLKIEIENTGKEREELTARISAFESEKVSIENEREMLRRELEEKAKQNEETLSALNEELENKKNELAFAKEEGEKGLQKVKKENENLIGRIFTLEKEHSELSEDVKILQLNIKTKDEELASTKKGLEEFDNLKTDFKDKTREKDEEIEMSKVKIDTLNAKVKTMEEDMKEVYARITDVERANKH
jgi:hypothetical protein